MNISTQSSIDSYRLEAFLPSRSGDNQEVVAVASSKSIGASQNTKEIAEEVDETRDESTTDEVIAAEPAIQARSDAPPKRDSRYRASTARVDLHEIRARLEQMEDMLRDRQGERDNSKTEVGSDEDEANDIEIEDTASKNTCEYDLTKHTLSYLPTPIMSQVRAVTKDQQDTQRNLTDKTKFLGVQPASTIVNNGMRSSIFIPDHVSEVDIDMDPEFDSMFGPDDMRLLALVSHNNMKASMKQFVLANMNILKKFRLTGTNTTMSMLKEVFGEDPDVAYGPSCKSGPLGGDAQLVAMAVTGELGGCIFFIDPMDAHPHSADIECLVRQGNVHNILMMNNPTTAHVCMNTLRVALKMGRMEMVPSFFFDLESPSVDAYKTRQKNVLKNAISRVSTIIATRENKVNYKMKKANAEYLKYRESVKKVSFSDDKTDTSSSAEERESAPGEERAIDLL